MTPALDAPLRTRVEAALDIAKKARADMVRRPTLATLTGFAALDKIVTLLEKSDG